MTPCSIGARYTDLTIDTVDSSEQFLKLASPWNALLAQSDADGLFLTWEWAFSWWEHLAGDCELRIMTVHRAGELIAIAPFVLRRASLQSLPPVSALEFLGSGIAGSDYLDLIVKRGEEEAVADALADRLSSSGRTLALLRMRPGGPAALLVDRLQQRRWHAWRGPTELCPYASLHGHTFDSYLRTLSAEHRYGFRRKLARLDRKHSARFELVSTHRARRVALATLFALHDRRWQARGEPGAFSTPALRAFHEDVSARALDAGWLRLWVLHLDGEPVAALYGFLRERKFLFYQAGFDPAHARDSVGMVLLGVAIRDAIGDGADEVDLLHGTERYKAHWTRGVRELSRVELHAPGTRGFLEREATALTRRARKVTRAALELGRRIVPINPADDHAALR